MTAPGSSAPWRRTFSYLFPDLAADPASRLPYTAGGALKPDIVAALRQLATGMKDQRPAAVRGNSTIPAGLTYFGQFVAHDIAYDPSRLPAQPIDAGQIENVRTPWLNLDSVYAGGPADSPFLFDWRVPSLRGVTFRVGSGQNTSDDLPRNKDGIALLGDPRNDDNLLVAQVHLAVMLFHNAVAGALAAGGASGADLFTAARATVVRHFQWIVVKELLEGLLEPGAVAASLARAPASLPGADGSMPAEFAMAGFRFGHSMVRDRYVLNVAQQEIPLEKLFEFTGAGGTGGPTVVPSDWVPLRSNFVDDPAVAHVAVNRARPIDGWISEGLYALPGAPGVVPVPEATLRRGYACGLPTGERVAAKIGAVLLTQAELTAGYGPLGDGTGYPAVLLGQTPLWYYVLKEAQVRGAGNRLGPVGSRIVADTVVGLLRADPGSYVNAQAWVPTLGSTPGTFSMRELLRVATLWIP